LTIKPKKFKDVASVTDSKYVLKKKVEEVIRYEVRNGQVIIDLKGVIDNILDEETIGKYKLDKATLNVPFDINKQVTGNSMSMVLNKNRFTMRLKAVEILPSKQQKIDYDNTHAHRWKIPQWVKFIEDLFYQTYDCKAIELDLRGQQGGMKRGKIYSQIKSLQTKIEGLGYGDKHMVHYLRWAFAKKSKRTTLTLGLLGSDSMIQEWTVYLRTQKNKTTNRKQARKWDG
jgi:hypothetical protein